MLLLHLPLLLPRNISGCYFSVLDVLSRKLLSNITCCNSADSPHNHILSTLLHSYCLLLDNAQSNDRTAITCTSSHKTERLFRVKQLLLYWWLELLNPLMNGAAVFAVAECRLLDDATILLWPAAWMRLLTVAQLE